MVKKYANKFCTVEKYFHFVFNLHTEYLDKSKHFLPPKIIYLTLFSKILASFIFFILVVETLFGGKYPFICENLTTSCNFFMWKAISSQLFCNFLVFKEYSM